MRREGKSREEKQFKKFVHFESVVSYYCALVNFRHQFYSAVNYRLLERRIKIVLNSAFLKKDWFHSKDYGAR